MHRLAPAKINLHLRVGPLAEDGFHPIASWMVGLSLCDTLTFTRANHAADERAPLRLWLMCDEPRVPVDRGNLIFKAARAIDPQADLAPHVGLANLTIHLAKQIPMGGGLGGGSADAAITLLALNAMRDHPHSPAILHSMAAKLGSDVPFFLYEASAKGTGAICTGRGERIEPTPRPAARWALLMLPDFGMPTGLVYERFDTLHRGEIETLANLPDWHAWAALGARDLLPQLVNDLEAPAFDLSRQLRQLHGAAQERLGRPVRMSGSGSTLFTLFDDQATALEAAGTMGDLAVEPVVVEIAPDSLEMK